MATIILRNNNCFNNRCNNNCCNNNCCNNNTIIIRRRNTNNTTIQNTRIAQFYSLNNIFIEENQIIPMNVNQYNNIQDIIQLDGGTIDILSQGVYEIEYNTVVQNPNDETINATLTLQVNGVVNSRATAIETLAPNAFASLTNRLIITVVSGATAVVALVNVTTSEILVVNSNIVVTKLT